MAPFRRRSEAELAAFSDEQLLAYMRSARVAGDLDAVTLPLQLLVWRHKGNVVRRVQAKVPPRDVEDVAMSAIVEAVGSAFDRELKAQFRAWLNTIVQRRIADYWRAHERSVEQTPLPEEHEGEDDEGVWGAGPATDGGQSAVPVMLLVEEVLAELSDQHVRVIDLYVFGDLSARETAAQIEGMSEDNVHQIAHRFRAHLRDLLEGEGG